MKRQPIEWEKIFANEVTTKGLTSKNEINKDQTQRTTIKSSKGETTNNT